jgi:hypothetical protein
MKLLKTPWMRWTVGAIFSVAIVGASYIGARHYAWPAYKAYRIQKMNREARAFLKAGDLANALLIARKSLQSSTVNAEAWRIAAAAAKARGASDVITYQDNLCRVEPSRENYLELMRLALRFDVPGIALTPLKALAAGGRGDPEYHRLAADVFLRLAQPLDARYHLRELMQLRPTDAVAQLDLAEIELAADTARVDTALRERVRALSARPEFSRRAVAMLLRDNLAGHVVPGTGELARRLAAVADLDVGERLLVIEGYQAVSAAGVPGLIARLENDVAERPADVARVADFLMRTGGEAGAAAWVATLSPATRGDEDVRAVVAEILRRQHAWTALEIHLRGPQWSRREFLRQALLAYCYRAQGRSADFAESWNLALIEAGGELRKTLVLLAKVQEWKWVQERYALVWKLFLLVPANEGVRQTLIVWERNQGGTANLNRIFARLVQLEGADSTARNNLAYTDLLLGTNIVRAAQISADLVKAEPNNAYFVTTHALALYRQDRPAEALAQMDRLTLTERTDPVRMLFRAVFLARIGRLAPAAELLNGVVLTGMLPEEKRLADETKQEIARLDRVQGNRSRLLAFRKTNEETAGRTGWLALVAPATRLTATTDMQLADSLYAAGEWENLAELLHTTSWKGEDHLRFALAAYVDRQRGRDLSSRESWRLALATADRNTLRVQNLRALATRWQWQAERLEAANIIFERNSTDRVLLEELLQDYRALRRTPDLVRVLGLYTANTGDTTDEAVALAYYSLLLDSNLARTHVLARNAFSAAPADTMRRLVYAFSLWKQNRSAEAVPLLVEVNSAAPTGVVQVALLRAVILAQMGSTVQAVETLARFDETNALPEEIRLARKTAGLLTSKGDQIRRPPT